MIFRAHSAANPLRRTRTRTDDVFNVYMYVFLMLSKKHIDVKKIKVNVSMIELRSTLMISADLINARSLHGRSTALSRSCRHLILAYVLATLNDLI